MNRHLNFLRYGVAVEMGLNVIYPTKSGKLLVGGAELVLGLSGLDKQLHGPMFCLTCSAQITRTHLYPPLPSSPYLKIVFEFGIGILKALRQIEAIQVPSQCLYRSLLFWNRTKCKEIHCISLIAFLQLSQIKHQPGAIWLCRGHITMNLLHTLCSLVMPVYGQAT